MNCSLCLKGTAAVGKQVGKIVNMNHPEQIGIVTDMPVSCNNSFTGRQLEVINRDIIRFDLCLSSTVNR